MCRLGSWRGLGHPVEGGGVLLERAALHPPSSCAGPTDGASLWGVGGRWWPQVPCTPQPASGALQAVVSSGVQWPCPETWPPSSPSLLAPPAPSLRPQAPPAFWAAWAHHMAGMFVGRAAGQGLPPWDKPLLPSGRQAGLDRSCAQPACPHRPGLHRDQLGLEPGEEVRCPLRAAASAGEAPAGPSSSPREALALETPQSDSLLQAARWQGPSLAPGSQPRTQAA